MGGARGRRQANRNEARLSLQAEVLVVHDPERRRRQLTAIRNLLVTLGSRVGEPPTSDVGVGGGAARVAGLEGLMGRLEADVVRVIWAANAPLSARHVLRKLNEGRSRPLRYTTVQTAMARLARKRVLARSRHGRVDLYRAVAPNAASIAVSRLLAQFEEAATRPFIEQASREPSPGRRCAQLCRSFPDRTSRRPTSCRMLVSSAASKESGDRNPIHILAGDGPCSDPPVGAEGE